jgi:site-specific DNA-methyltransferase (adenine-specific)
MYELFLGNCLEIMTRIPDNSVDTIICDLPYGTTNCQWDVIIPFDKLWEQYNRITKENSAIVLFGCEPFSSYLRLSNITNYKYDWLWEKERPTNILQMKRRPGKTIETISIFYKSQCCYNPQMVKHDGPKRTNKVKNGKLGKIIDNSTKKPTEYVDTGFRYPTQVLKFKRDVLTSNLHPTQKPLALLEYLINTYSNENYTILDNTMGSGTTGVACINTNRNFIGIELNNEYYEIAKNRIEKAVFDNKPPKLSNFLK